MGMGIHVTAQKSILLVHRFAGNDSINSNNSYSINSNNSYYINSNNSYSININNSYYYY